MATSALGRVGKFGWSADHIRPIVPETACAPDENLLDSSHYGPLIASQSFNRNGLLCGKRQGSAGTGLNLPSPLQLYRALLVLQQGVLRHRDPTREGRDLRHPHRHRNLARLDHPKSDSRIDNQSNWSVPIQPETRVQAGSSGIGGRSCRPKVLTPTDVGRSLACPDLPTVGANLKRPPCGLSKRSRKLPRAGRQCSPREILPPSFCLRRRDARADPGHASPRACC
jgi:hypothetical protein